MADYKSDDHKSDLGKKKSSGVFSHEPQLKKKSQKVTSAVWNKTKKCTHTSSTAVQLNFKSAANFINNES